MKVRDRLTQYNRKLTKLWSQALQELTTKENESRMKMITLTLIHSGMRKFCHSHTMGKSQIAPQFRNLRVLDILSD